MLGFDLPARWTNSLEVGANSQKFLRREKLEVFGGQTKTLKVGREAEDFSIGDDLFLSNLKGSLIFLVFWKTLWTRCQQEAPVIEREIWQRFKDKGLKVFAIGVKENGEQASSWSFQHRLTYPVIIDPEGEIYKKFGTGSVPYHVIIDRDFRIRLSQEDFEKSVLIEITRDTLKWG